MAKFLAVLRVLTTIATILLLGFLAWHCIDIYLDGAELSSLQAIFTYEEVAQRLKGFALPVALYVILVCVTLLLQTIRPVSKQRTKTRTSHKAACLESAVPTSKVSMFRWAMLFVGALLVLWGIANGSLYDVLVKSINICTECIGLG